MIISLHPIRLSSPKDLASDCSLLTTILPRRSCQERRHGKCLIGEEESERAAEMQDCLGGRLIMAKNDSRVLLVKRRCHTFQRALQRPPLVCHQQRHRPHHTWRYEAYGTCMHARMLQAGILPFPALTHTPLFIFVGGFNHVGEVQEKAGSMTSPPSQAFDADSSIVSPLTKVQWGPTRRLQSRLTCCRHELVLPSHARLLCPPSSQSQSRADHTHPLGKSCCCGGCLVHGPGSRGRFAFFSSSFSATSLATLFEPGLGLCSPTLTPRTRRDACAGIQSFTLSASDSSLILRRSSHTYFNEAWPASPLLYRRQEQESDAGLKSIMDIRPS